MIFLGLFIICINIISIYGVMPSETEECKSVTDFFDNYSKTSGHTLKIPQCCDDSNKYHHIYCKNGHISEIQLRYNNKNEAIDFSNFPLLPNLEYFLTEGHMYKDGILPSRLFEMKSLKTLKILSSNLSKVPEKIDSCELEELSVYNNSISGFPHSFMKCTKLKHLDLSRNAGIETIPDSISTLKNLDNLYLGMTGLKSLSEEVFKLKITNFDIDGNPNLSTKIYNFGKKVDKCDFRNTNIICYEPNTCENFVVQDSPRVYNNDTNNVYKKCDATSKGKSFSSKKLWLILIPILLLVLLCIICLLLCCRRQKKEKEMEEGGNETKEDIFIPPIAPVNDISTTFIHKIDPSNSRGRTLSNNTKKTNNIDSLYTHVINNTSISNADLNDVKNSLNNISIIPVTTVSSDPITSPTSPLSGIEIDTTSAPASADLNLSPIPNANEYNSFSIVDTTIDNINSILPITNLPSFNETVLQSTKQYESIPATSPMNVRLDAPTITGPSQSSIICHPSSSSESYEMSPSLTKNSFSIGYENEINNNISLYYSDIMDDIPENTKPSKQTSSIQPLKSTSHLYSNIPSSED